VADRGLMQSKRTISRRSRENISLLLTFLFASILFSPLFNLRVHLRIDQAVFIVIFPILPILLMKERFALHLYDTVGVFLVFPLLTAFSASLTNVYSSFTTGSINSYFAVNWPAKILLNVLMGGAILIFYNKKSSIFERSLRLLWLGTVIVGIIGIVQVAELNRLIPNLGINGFLSKFFPYRGEVSYAFLEKSGGYALKVGGIGRATSTMDGHPILLGDFLAFVLVLVLPLVENWRRMGQYLAPLLCLLLTLSRGSILGWMVGVLGYFGLKSFYNWKGKRMRMAKSIVLILILVCFILVLYMSSPFVSIRWRVESTIATLLGRGGLEARFADRWPQLFSSLSEGGMGRWLLGIPGGYGDSTDSQYLLILANGGLVGVTVFLSFHVYLFLSGLRVFTNAWRSDQERALLGLSYSSAIIALLTSYVFHPSLQGDRLLTTLILISMFLRATLARTESEGEV